MFRKTIAFTALMGLLLALFALPAVTGAESTGTAVPADPATPTDLDCAHEHTRTVIYFFDSPVYTAISSASHRVSGPGVVEVTCLDCGEIISSDVEDNAEEVRPHTMKNGVCALCGYHLHHSAGSLLLPEDFPGERTLIAEGDGDEGLLTLTLTRLDLKALANAGIKTAVIRGETGKAAIAFSVEELRSLTAEREADLTVELSEIEDGSVFVGLYLVGKENERVAPETDGFTLRFYQDQKTDVKVSVEPVDTSDMKEAEGVWDERGFWFVPYTDEGTYFFLQ